MKIDIANLGILKQAHIELQPLTVFIGGNNTGKTWTAYTLASLFSLQGYRSYLQAYLDGKIQQNYPPLDSAIQQVLDEGNARINL